MPNFHRDHYLVLADEVRAVVLETWIANNQGAGQSLDPVRELVERFCVRFKADNPNFSRDQFVKACGL